MSNEFSNLDIVRTVLANTQRFPDGTPVDWDSISREGAARRLFSSVLHLFPGARLIFDDQDRSDYARIILPSKTSLGHWPYASIILSQVDSFVTIAYAPGMPSPLEHSLLHIFEKEGFNFISFANFCPNLPPEDSVEAWNNWEPANEDLWRSLFDYY